MQYNNNYKSRASLRKKIIIVICGIFFSIVLLEAGLRLFGFVSSSIQEYRNKTSVYKKGAYRIMCLGESTTARQYPGPLEEILNKRNIGIRFSVIDKGVPGANTEIILSELEENLNKYKPYMVITMMGYNDRYMMYYKDIPESNTKLFQYCRVYRLMRIIYMHILNKLNKKDIFSLGRADSMRKTKLKKIESRDKKSFSPSEEPLERKDAGLNLKEDRKYIELGGSYQTQGKFTKNIEGYCKLGWICLVQGKFPEAEYLFMKALGLNASSDEAYVGLGRIYQIQGKFSESEVSFKKALQLNLNNHLAYLGLGEVYRSLNKLPEADELFKKVIELNPRLYESYVGLGVRIGEFYPAQGSKLAEEAAVSFKKAIDINPKVEWLYIELGDIYRSQGKLSMAEALFKKALELNPKNDRTYVVLGELYRGQGKSFREAEVLFKKAIELNPKSDWAYVGLGRLYQFNIKNNSEAEVLFKKALELNPKNDKAYVGLGEICLIQGKLFESEIAFKKAFELNPDNDWISRALEGLYRQTNRIELAEEYKKKSVGLNLKEYSYSQVAINNHHKLKEILDKRGIRLVCVQYAMRSVKPLKKIFEGQKGVIFVDNEEMFRNAIKEGGYKEYFTDMFGGDFGHCTQKGNRLLADNIADVVLKEVFHK